MTLSTTSGFPTTATAPGDRKPGSGPRRRCVTAESGRAMEILGHAIEYLIDESMNEVPTSFLKREKLDAIQILTDLNHQVYFDCPEVPSFGERCRALLRRRRA